MNCKGQSYLVVSFILVGIMVTTSVAVRTPVHQKTEGHFVMENIETELPLSYTAGVYQDDINAVLSETTNEFMDFTGEKGYQMKMVFSATESIGAARFYHIGNWWSEDCTYYNTKIGPNSLPYGATTFHPRGYFQSDYNLIVCGQTLNLTEDFDFRAEIHREGEVIVNEDV